ncbi:hypothetical protein [Dyadobacter sediminis]|uniref:Glycosyltransferase RgtA/B/C/D-like domain-containing protein n=1 Tax=Dyadobacter sediminis TaxID=1493691 RepID=A0A5R9KFK6_9BACT|nr:hypothetical protein [Dyadobacter sediminis]TLU94846.1 hypothetical protein FEM55_11560 [Dyadobacter sediminis]GGB87474.1 hypothetical protein GCM10011325_13810 [Dyadobacter sediminis]
MHLFSGQRLYFVLFVFILLTAATYYHRFPTGDDAWFGEQSYWLEKEGVIRSEFFRGIAGWEKQLLVSHKLFLAVGALFIHFFGFHLPVLQFTGLLFFSIMTAEIAFYVRSRVSAENSGFVPAILILVFTNRLLIKMSFENRPEMMLAAFGFGAFLLIRNKGNKLHMAAGGMLAGLAFLSHLNGIIYVIAGIGTLLLLKRYRDAICFGIFSSLTCALYLTDILLTENGFKIWWYQFRHDPATQAAFGFQTKLIQILTYPRIFFHSPEQIALSLLLVYMLWVQRNLIRKLPSELKRFSLILFFSFWLITKGNGGLYLPLFMPFMFALVFELYKIRPFVNTGLKLVLLAYLIIGIFGTVQLIVKNHKLGFLPDTYSKLRKHLPGKTTGVVPLTFFYNEYEQFPRLLTHENYKLYAQKKNMTAGKFGTWAYKKGADFILMDYEFNAESYFPAPGTAGIPFYHLVYFDGRFAVYYK